jgi:putative component of toxin-antitoxin plasmid stabilization module
VKLIWYPSYLENDEKASVKAFIRKDLAKYPDLRLRVKTFLDRLKDLQDLQPLFNSEQLAPVHDGLFEMRIPPRRRGGVVRIYYCVGQDDSKTFVLLDAELKHETDPGRTGTALKRMATYIESTKGRPNDGKKRR